MHGTHCSNIFSSLKLIGAIESHEVTPCMTSSQFIRSRFIVKVPLLGIKEIWNFFTFCFVKGNSLFSFYCGFGFVFLKTSIGFTFSACGNKSLL